MSARSKATIKGEFLSPYGSDLPTISVRLPGFDGPRPLLSLVLTILAGQPSETIQSHLSMGLLASPSSRDAVDELLRDPQAIGFAEASMVETMRNLADLWIDSGKSRSDPDVDTPSERNVEDVLPGQHVSLFWRLNNDLLNNLPRQIGMMRDGKQGIKEALPSFKDDGARSALDLPLESFSRRLAMYWFSKLLDSRYSRHLARCDKCKGYFAYDRAPKRTIKYGIFCPQCKGSGSVKRTQSTRNRRNQQRIEFAASVWEQWKPMRSYGNRSNWVANKVNVTLKQTLTGRWVTQHQQDIEAEVERRNHATGKG